MNLQEDSGHHSLFQHEADAITLLERRISAHKLGFILNNLEVHATLRRMWSLYVSLAFT